MGLLILLALYISFFGTIHSLMATKRFKNKVYRFLDQKQYRLIYSIISVILTIPIVLIWRMGRDSSPLFFVVKPQYNLVSYLIMLIGAALFVLTTKQVDLGEFLGIDIPKKKKESDLIIEGFYQICRHPMYLFAMIILWASPELRLIDLVGNSLLSLYFILGGWFEEKKMIEDFGQEYLDYKEEVSMFIPIKWFKKKLKL